MALATTHGARPGRIARTTYGWRCVAALLLVPLAAPPASANDDDDDDDPSLNITRALLESAAVFGFQFSLLVHEWDDEKIDFDLQWDRDSWRRKIDLSALHFDTNTFSLNAVGHPLQSLVQYKIARSNGFGMLGSEVFVTVYGVLWEYLAEFREYPSINDIIVDSTTGIEIGEPFWQIAQLWRGGDLTVADRVKTTIFSPVDGLHDLFGHHRGPRRVAWRSMTGEAGLLRRSDEGTTRVDASLNADIDLVADRHYVAQGDHAGPIKPGSWSRVRGRLDIGSDGTESRIMNVGFETRTAIAGYYAQEADGRGLFVGLGTAFTYRRDRLADTWDHVGIPHILGPQVQLSYRTPALAVRWDAAAYADFDMIDALVFAGQNAFVAPPPYVSALQAHGYYYGYGATTTSRLRVDTADWGLDAEVSGHRAWQIDSHDRIETTPPAPLNSSKRFNAHGNSDTRAYARGELTYHHDRVGLSVVVEGEYRAGHWLNLDVSSTATTIGLLGRADL